MTLCATKHDIAAGRKSGCFWANCLSGKAAFTSVDGFTVVGDSVLILQWRDSKELSPGERIIFERITAQSPVTVMIVEGDAEDMTVETLCVVRHGIIGPCEPADLESVQNAMRKWSAQALADLAVC